MRFRHRHRSSNNGNGVTVRVGGCAGAVLAIGILVFTLLVVGGTIACAVGTGNVRYGHHD